MKGRNRIKRALVGAAAVVWIFLGAAADGIGAEAKNGAGPAFKEVVVQPLVQWYGVDGDEGRFRQDWRVTDDLSGGVERFEAGTADGKVKMRGHAISENDYGHDIFVSLPKEDYLKINGKVFRQYYDGSGEPWDPATWLLPAEFADWEDEDLYADRLSQTIEYGRKLSEEAKVAWGYELWGRFGRERLLRGEQSARTGFYNTRSIPARSYLDGLSHTFYADYQRILSDKYTVHIRPSYEVYNDSQDIQFYRYNDGLLNQDRTFQDSPQFQDLSLQAGVDGFWSERAYLYSGYLFHYLRNGSVRSEVRPTGASTWTDPAVDNSRISHTGNLGTVLLDFLGIKGLRLGASARAEGADTNSRGYGTSGSATRGNFGHKELRSDIGEYWFSESLDLTYKGFKDTSLELGVDLDQRHLDYDEYFDSGSMEIFVDFGNAARRMSYNADLYYNDLKTTARASHRFNPHLKATGQYRIRYLDHDYDVNTDSSEGFYPGRLGDTLRQVNEATAGFDIWWRKSWSSALKYQYIGDNIHTQIGGDDVQDSDRHRLTMTLTGNPWPRFTCFGSAALEKYFLDTPTDAVPNSTWMAGPAPYDFSGDYFIYTISGSWALEADTRLNCRFQQTSSFGTTSDVQKNDLYEFRVGFSRRFGKDAELKVDYLHFDFNDKNDIVPGFDDYDGHGVICSYAAKWL
ncbi:MAG: hypothetical protein HYT89_00990 [Candidatus Omnitrophica bacterium]|nr:hypothetical protein [Candidatus Omnitrophota bacterium]